VYSTSEFRKGLKIELDGKPFIIVDFLHVKPGKGGAFVRTKLRNLITGAVIERTFRSGERVERPNLTEKKMQYHYKDDDGFHFMDMENYEQVYLTRDHVGDSMNFLADNLELVVLYHDEKPISLDLPTFVEIAIAETEPGVRGDTATGGTKPAKLTTGYVVLVPLFVEEGDVLRIDTRTGAYIERVTK